MTKPIIHLGLPKAASTFLQKRLFPWFKNYHYISSCFTGGEPCRWPAEWGWLYAIDYTLRNYPSFRDVPEWRSIKYRSFTLAQWVSSSKKFTNSASRPLLVSAEGLSGVSYNPLKNAKFVSELLYEILGDYRILLVTRRQDNWCESLYNQLILKENRYSRYIPFDTMFSSADNPAKYSRVIDLDWHRLAKIYLDLAGSDNVLVIPYELLCDEPKDFFREIASFFNEEIPIDQVVTKTKDNVSVPGMTYSEISYSLLVKRLGGAIKRAEYHRAHELLGTILSRLFNQESTTSKTVLPLDKHAKADLMSQVTDSNRRLQELVKTDLSRYGYS